MRHTQLCATVTAATMAELRTRRDQVRGADLVELRLDGVADVDVAGALADRRLPVVVTCRPARQGGRFDGAEETRLRLLEQAWDLGAEWVDVELDAAEALVARSGGARLLRSFHDFDGMPADLPALLARLLGSGTALVKLAVTARRLGDVVALDHAGRLAGGRAVLIAMGEAGVTSRILAARLGSPWTYAGDSVAPGQLPLARMRDELRVPSITADTAVYGVVGRPIAHSLSPAMHNAAFAAAGLDAVYLPLAAADFADFEQFAAHFALAGASVTAPFKVDACHASLPRDTAVAAVGAVNTLRRREGGGWESCNTDGEGFLAPLRGHALHGRRVAILGAGGAARGVAAALEPTGAITTVHARRADAAAAVADATGATARPWPPPPDSWDVLVNATPVGTASADQTPLTLDGRLDGRLVYDLIYVPLETALLRRARALGAEVIGGLPMLVAQAAAQFTWWTGGPAPAEVMHQAALQRLDAQAGEQAVSHAS